MLNLDQQNGLRERLRESRPYWQPATQLFSALVRAHLWPGGMVLDVGCGRGGLVEQLTHPLEQIVGVDPDLHSLQTHRLNMQRTNALYPLPFGDGTFDVVYASWVLEHWARPERELTEIARILKPNGVFIFITPNALHPLLRLNRGIAWAKLQTVLVQKLYGRDETDTFPVHYRMNTADTIQQIAQTAGLNVDTLHLVDDPTYLAVFPALFDIAQRIDEKFPAIHIVGALSKST